MSNITNHENKKPWYRSVRPGDMLKPIPLWNKTERVSSHLPGLVKILEVKSARSQSGVLFVVRVKNGMLRELDAVWFQEPEQNP